MLATLHHHRHRETDLHHAGIALAASLLEAIGPLPFAGGQHGGLPYARQGGSDSPAIITEQQLQIYRGVARWAYEQNEYYGGLIDRLTDYTCGRGYEWKAGQRGWMQPPGSDPPPHIQFAQEVLDDFRHADGWRSRHREEVRRVNRDGESFRRLFAPRQFGGLPQCRFVEPAHVTAPPGHMEQEWRFGVLTLPHDAERHLAYYVRTHPDDPGEVVLAAGVTWSMIPGDYISDLRRGAGCIVHRKESRCDRAVKRGLPLFWGGTDGLQQAESLIDNLTAVAAYLSTIAYFRQHAPGITGAGITDFQQGILARQQDTLGSVGSGDAVPASIMAVGSLFAGWRGLADPSATQFGLGPTVKDITNGMAMQPPPVNGNITGFLAILQARIRAACVLVGAPEYLGSADASNNNFASIKEAGSPFVVATEGRQQDCADGDQRVAETVVRYAGADYPGMRVAVTPPEVAIRSDQEKAATTNSKIQGKWMSPQEAIRADGRDPKQTMAEIRDWEDAFPDAGAMLPGFGDGGGAQ